jgi:hypothetical protein
MRTHRPGFIIFNDTMLFLYGDALFFVLAMMPPLWVLPAHGCGDPPPTPARSAQPICALRHGHVWFAALAWDDKTRYNKSK